MNVKDIKEEELYWRRFERYFMDKYFSKRYYDNKEKVFYEHKLGKLSADEYVSKFLELSRYVPYLNEFMLFLITLFIFI